jgi:hypothetical protein
MAAPAMAATVPATGHFNDLVDSVRVVNVFHFERHVNDHLLPAKYQPDISTDRGIYSYLTSRPYSPHYLPSSMTSSASSMSESEENQENCRYQLEKLNKSASLYEQQTHGMFCVKQPRTLSLSRFQI